MASELFKGFSHAQLYAKYRPFPPETFISSIMMYLKQKIGLPFDTAVDIGCGSGQSTVVLSPHFKKVLGIDVSSAQISQAQKINMVPNIEYKITNGQTFDVPPGSVQLVTLCQALHWFDTKHLFEQVKEMLVQNGVVATFGYWILLPHTNDQDKNQQIKNLIEKYLHDEVLGSYWHEGRFILQKRYKSMEFPFKEKKRFDLVIETKSDLTSFMGYLSSWSAYQKYAKENKSKGPELLQEITQKLLIILGESKSSKEVPLVVHTDYFMNMGCNCK